MSEVISSVLERTGLPAALANSDDDIERLYAGQDLTPQDAVGRAAYAHFLFWWSSCLSRFKPGTAVSAMWKAYPHGAILTDSDWSWWSLERVARDGTALAQTLGFEGLVIAEGRQGVAMLHWPGHQANAVVLRMVPFTASADSFPTVVDPCRFIASKGFDDSNRVIPCAVLGRSAPAHVVPQVRM
ncbi:MAG: hypothetical protein PSV26_03975 [Polaromonas sp.]|uniref:hypothetical protein n=1 Tax=Polaromonas sp. TaxID=1869339 RepID=UPI0024879FFB|nr:hypothetical protein [Polaromonas sp.]MDI1236623.1 hypothetical protein [Polaromonas sp.]